MKRLAIVLVAGCSSPHQAPPTVDAYQGSGASCSTLTSGISDFQPGVDDTPNGFPSPPTGLILCGTDPMTNSGLQPEGWYLAGTLSMTDVFSYYQMKLPLAGFTVQAPMSETGGNTKLVFTNGSAGTSGAVIYNSTELFVLVSFPP